MPLMASNMAAGGWRGNLLRGKQRVPLGLDRLDLLEQQFEPIELAADLSLEMLWQGTAIARPQLVEPSPTVAAQRLVTGYALGEQQSFDAIDVLDPLVDQHFALAAEAATIFFLGRRRFNHRAHSRFAALIRQQRAKQGLAVDPVGLGPPPPARRRDRGRIDDVAFDSFILAAPDESRSRRDPLPE